VIQYTGGVWVTVGNAGFSSANADYLSLDARSGTPYVAFSDTAAGYGASVMKLSGTTWAYVGTPGFSAGMIGFTSLAVDGNTPYLDYQDDVNSIGSTVKKFDGTNWVAVGPPNIGSYTSNLISMAVGSGNPYAAVQSPYLGDDLVLEYTNNAWVTVGTQNFMIGDGAQACVATNQSGNP